MSTDIIIIKKLASYQLILHTMSVHFKNFKTVFLHSLVIPKI
jgi:hypothetical protein